MSSIAFIGAGNMATAIMGGLIENGFSASDIWACDPSQEKLNELANQYGIQTTTDNVYAADHADCIILAVKPQVMEAVLTPLQSTIEKRQPLIISVAAGINLHSLATWAAKDGKPAIVRCMPNTPALVGEGASGLFANSSVTDEHKTLAENILNAVGISVWVNEESELDAVTAVSGSGPAYYFLFMEAMISAGKKLGLSHETAVQLTLKTALGAATMASNSVHDPAQLRKNVTSPNGTTEQAIKSFQENALEKLVEDALQAANDRSQELSEELGAK